MSKNIENKAGSDWEFSVGFYTGFLFGFRIYDNEETKNFVFYLPFVDFCLTVESYQ